MAANSAVDFLREEFSRRSARNPSFSLRAFARLVGISPGRISEIMSGRKPMGLRNAERVATQLQFDDKRREAFLNLVRKQQRGRVSSWASSKEDFGKVGDDAYKVVAEWHHFAILSLMETCGFENDPQWIAARLGISLGRVRAALVRVERLGLASKVRGRWRPTYARISTTNEIPSQALRSSHKQILRHAMVALDKVPLQQRSVTSATMAIDPKKLPRAKEMIAQFQAQLARFLETGVRTEVFDLNVQLVPVTVLEQLPAEAPAAKK